ncbi:AbrB/MazE/SpoVT family DNA-binding domain-containing protein [Thiovibrio sp. JS02]
MATATVTSKGQVTIPKEIRDYLKLRAGGRLEFLVDSQGNVRIAPATGEARQLKGLISPAKKAVSLEEMQSAIEQEGGRQ